MSTDFLYKEITEKVIGASFDVHSFLGNGFQACLPKGSMACRQEVIYQRALAYEMSQRNLEFAREIEQDIFYKDLSEPIGTRRADFVVEGKVLVEIKAIKELEDVHMAQALNYLKAYKLEIGLLINFGSKSLTFKRLISSSKKQL
uniref:GxxExxY protein n=1 Tax=Fulvivirga sp. TaxID=1931237 RepID=UPI00404B0FFF